MSLVPEWQQFIRIPMEALKERAEAQRAQEEWEYEKGIEAHLRHHIKGKTLVLHWWGSLVAYNE